jgi:hypothetical protein
MTCPVCNDDGVVTVEVRRSGGVVEKESRPCSSPSCVVGGVTRLYREMEK